MASTAKNLLKTWSLARRLRRSPKERTSNGATYRWYCGFVGIVKEACGVSTFASRFADISWARKGSLCPFSPHKELVFLQDHRIEDRVPVFVLCDKLRYMVECYELEIICSTLIEARKEFVCWLAGEDLCVSKELDS